MKKMNYLIVMENYGFINSSIISLEAFKQASAMESKKGRDENCFLNMLISFNYLYIYKSLSNLKSQLFPMCVFIGCLPFEN